MDKLTKIVNYEPLKIKIYAIGLGKNIIDVVISKRGLLDSILSESGRVLALSFWSSLYYSLKIKRQIPTIFPTQIDSQTHWQTI